MTSSVSETWQPPPGFVPVESSLPGVTVYAPALPVESGPEARTFKCPQCGATTAYDPAAASVTCAACGYQQALQAQVVGRRAAAAEFTLETLARESHGWGEARRELHCDACGANLSLSPTDLSTTCPFCASNRVVARVEGADALRPRFLIPFKVQAAECVRLAREWLGRGWMHPQGLAALAHTVRFTGIYLPFWTFSARIIAAWHAEVGYERQERYYDPGSKDWKTRTKIEWRWENGQVVLPVSDLLAPGTARVSRALLQRLYPFDLSQLTAYDPGFLAGWQAQGYDVPLPQAWDQARAEMRDRAKQACRDDIASSRVRGLSVSAAFDDESWRYILLPVFVAAYRFNGQPYQLLINGQTGAVAGQKPVDWARVWLAVAALLAPGLLFGLIGLPLLLVGGIGSVLLAIGGVLFVLGVVLSGLILRRATQAGEL